MIHPDPAGAKRWLVLGLSVLVGCGKSAAAIETGPERAARKERKFHEEGVPVRTFEPKLTRFRGRIVVTGDLRADRSALLGFPVGGRLERIDVMRGEVVRARQPLGALGDAQARAAVAQAKAGLRAARAQLRIADDGLRRTEAMRRQEAASEAQALQASAQRELAAAHLSVARAQVEQAQVQKDYHVLLAPFDGIVTQVPSGLGITVAPGIPLFGLEDTRTLVLDSSVTPWQAATLSAGTEVRVTVPATGAAMTGVLRAVVRAGDPAAHRIPIEIAVPNPRGGLTPHILARAELDTGERSALELPATSLVQREGALVVFALADGSRARRVPVQVLSQEGGASLVEVDHSLTEFRVVDQPPSDLVEGARLATQEAP
jgi:RND family efflux transporter MFP subunit